MSIKIRPCAMCGETHMTLALTEMRGGALVCERCLNQMPELRKWVK